MWLPDSILVTGAAGVIGRIVVSDLARDYSVLAVDVKERPPFWPDSVAYLRESAASVEVADALPGTRFVLHLSTAADQDWRALADVVIGQTRWLLRQAASASVERVVLASTNNVTGGYERDLLQGRLRTLDPALLFSTPRPDSEYAAAKLFVEGYGRYIADSTQTSISCLRIGTVRSEDDPSAAVEEPGFEWIPGGKDGRSSRFRRTWLHHDDLSRIVREELQATEPFRLRYAVSDNPGRYWPLSVSTK